MINRTLFKWEMKNSVKLLVIFGVILTMYVSVIIYMYDPKMMATLDSFAEIMPEIMSAMGMSTGSKTLTGFMISYLYGFILLIFPMIFSILRGNALIAGYVDKGSMTVLVAAPVKRKTIAFTQMMVLVSCSITLIVYVTALELLMIRLRFSGEAVLSELLALNAGLLSLQLFIGSICFFASCLFSETRYSVGFGAGIPALMYILQMLANVGEKAEAAKYFSLFTLFDPEGIVAGDTNAIICVGVLLAGAVVLFTLGVVIFSKKDLQI